MRITGIASTSISLNRREFPRCILGDWLTRIPFQVAHGGTCWVDVDGGKQGQISGVYSSATVHLLVPTLLHDWRDQVKLSSNI